MEQWSLRTGSTVSGENWSKSENVALKAEQKNCVSSGPDELLREAHFREHNLEADHLANLGTDGQRKITAEAVRNTEVRKAVRGYWDDGNKDNGRGEWRCDESS